MASNNDKAKDGDKGGPPPPPPSPIAKKVKRVEITCKEGTRVDHKLLKNGDVTDDPAYVALLGDKRELVRAID